MKPCLTDLGTPRRVFLVVIVVLALVLAWELSEPWRTGFEEHRIGSRSRLGRMFGPSPLLSLGTNNLWWYYKGEGDGYLNITFPSSREWQFAVCAQTNLFAVTPLDAKAQFATDDVSGVKVFGKDWDTNYLVIHERQILLLRHSADTQTVYAVEVVEQRDSVGRFRSRKILPAPR